MSIRILMSLIFLLPVYVSAATVDCGYGDVGNLHVQSARSDGSSYNNKLIVELLGDRDGCPIYGYVSNTDPAYSSILSMLLAAKMSQVQIRILINNNELLSSAARIETVNFK